MASSKHFDNLPNEIVLKIFSYLGLEDLALSVQNVNSRWKDISQDNKLWKNIDFHPPAELNDNEIVTYFKSLSALKSYTASRVTSEFVIKALCKYCRHIKSIDLIDAQNVRLSLLKTILRSYPKIESLKLQYPSTFDLINCMKLIAQCETLTTLTLKGNFEDVCCLHENALIPITHGCSSLQHVDIGDYGLVDQEILNFLESKKHQLLSFSCKITITKGFSEKISECTKLQYINIVNFNDQLQYCDIQPLERLTALKHLSLPFLTEYVIDYIPSFILSGSFAQVVHLDFSESYFMNDVALNVICKNCPNIRHLNISGSQSLHNEGLRYIGCCKLLEHLDVSVCMDLTDGSMKYIQDCQNLRNLNITGCYRMTDAVIEHIVKCEKLCILKFNYNDLSGLNFHLISTHLHHLSELHLESCMYLKESFVIELHRKMPNLKIIVARRYKQTNLDPERVLLFD